MSAWTWKKRGLNSLQSDSPVSPEKDLECALAMELEINWEKDDTMLKHFYLLLPEGLSELARDLF